jgi:hypothetical protein
MNQLTFYFNGLIDIFFLIHFYPFKKNGRGKNELEKIVEHYKG